MGQKKTDLDSIQPRSRSNGLRIWPFFRAKKAILHRNRKLISFIAPLFRHITKKIRAETVCVSGYAINGFWVFMDTIVHVCLAFRPSLTLFDPFGGAFLFLGSKKGWSCFSGSWGQKMGSTPHFSEDLNYRSVKESNRDEQVRPQPKKVRFRFDLTKKSSIRSAQRWLWSYPTQVTFAVSVFSSKFNCAKEIFFFVFWLPLGLWGAMSSHLTLARVRGRNGFLSRTRHSGQGW